MTELQLSRLAHEITDSITLAITARAKQMRAAGQDVVSLGAGEPDFPTPEVIADSGVAAIRDGHTRYTAASGVAELRAGAARWFGRHFGLDYAAENIVVTAGAKPALTLSMMALVNPGDRVLIPGPFWSSYPDIVKLAGGIPVPLEAEPDQGFLHTGAQIAAALKEHGCRAIMLNTPNNPSGAVPSREHVAEVAKAIAASDAWLVSDEIYGRLTYDDHVHVSPATFDECKARTVVINGGTKSHSMTGWRCGFVAAPKEVAAAIGRLQSQAIGNTCSISQQAAITLCDLEDDAEFERRLAAFDERRRWMCDAINAIDGLSLARPQGAFYALVDARPVCERLGIDDIQLAERLLVEGLVATVPGSAFAAPGFMRLSYAASMEDLDKAVGRVKEFVKNAN